MRPLRPALVAALFVLALAAPAARADTVVIDSVDPAGQASAFQPPNVTIDAGDTVRWEFDQAATTHTVTSSSANWTLDETRSPNGAAIDHTFTAAGTYTFLCTIHNGMTGSVTVGAADPLQRVLVFSKTAGFRHDSIPQGIAAIQALGAANDFAVDASEDSAVFTDANLARYDVVVFLSTTGDILDTGQQASFERYIQAGGGFAGIHAASDTEYTWPWYGQMLGAYFRNHPAGTPTATVAIEDANEPSTTGLPSPWSRVDEWYNFQPPSNPVVNGNQPGIQDYSPRESGVHVLATVDEASYDEADDSAGADDHPVAWCTNYDGGRAWYTAMGHTQASFADADFRKHLLGGIQTAAGAVAADCGDQREAPPGASDFEVVALDDDTKSPMELAVAKDGRVFYVERITGEVKLIKPDGSVLTAGVIPVASVQENGALGIALDPSFATNHNLYISYTPLPNSSTETRISRFTVNGDQLDMLSERVILTYNNQRTECCHSSGSLAFGPDGSLYMSTGDNTNPFASDGYAPIDERPGRAFWDAQRTSANTNSYSGKILRILPLADPTGPGLGTGYTIPSGNLFPEAEDTQNKTLPEIFAMGFRNPFRITIDPISGNVLMGDYGPDAGATNANRGPQGSVEYNVVTPGNYGWPYCVRDNVPYNDYDFATSTSGAKFNCSAPVNTSPNNTGLTNLPPVKPAVMWMGYSETDARHPALGTGGAPTGGPRYKFDAGLDSDTKFPQFYDGHWFIGEWNNGWIKSATLSAAGNVTSVNDTPWMDTFARPHEMEFGPDGSLYVIDWGTGFNGDNLDSGIYRIDYIKGARRPIAHAASTPDSGPAPLAVQFSSEGSVDPEGTSLTYAWDFDGNGTTDSTDANPSHTYTAAGNYNVRLTVTDQAGQTGTDTLLVVAGNTRPTIEIQIPQDGQFADFGDTVPYKIVVSDPEDGMIDCSKVTLSIQLGHDTHAHGLGQKTGCEGTFETLSDAGHDPNANIFTSIVASYTDKGNGVAQALTAQDDVVLHTRRVRAEHFTATGRIDGSTATGDPGVQKEATGDAGGGNNVGFIEHGDWVSFARVNLKDTNGFRFRVASGGAGGTIQVRLDSPTGTLVGETATIAPTGGWQNWANVDLAIADPPSGTHTLFLVFKNPADPGGLMNLNWFQVSGKGAAVTAPPSISATATPATGQAPLPVQFDSTASDPEGGALTYAWDFGVSGTTADTSTQADPAYTYANPGTYTAKVTVTDPEGAKATASTQVRVTGAPSQCPSNARSDEFDGDSLDTSRWDVQRSLDNFRVSNGRLELPIDNGSMYQTGTSAKNLITQPTPSGEWTVTAKVTAELTENYHQAGLRVWSDDDNWASVHMISAGGNRQFEFIYEANGTPRNGAADNTGALPADTATTYYVRIHSDGTQLTAFYSLNGDVFAPVGQPAPLSTFANPQIGPTALSDAAPTKPMSYFDWIRFDPDEGTGGGGGGVVLDEFEGTDVAAPPWEVVRRDQAMTVGAGALHIPAQPGDIYGDKNDAKNLVLRAAPDGAFTATTKVSFEGNAQWHQAGMLLYADDGNFIKLGRLATDATGTEKFEFILESAGTPRNEAADSTGNLPADFAKDYYLRITSDGTNATGAYSVNGTDWTDVGRAAAIPAGAKLGVFAFNNAAATSPVADFDWFRIEGDGAGGGGPAGPSRDDQFDGSSLDKDRWNAIVRDNPASYAVNGGSLKITLESGDIYTGDTTPPPNNFILQSADHAGADWVIETKLDPNLSDGYGQGGLMAYVDGSNYVKFDAISDVGNTRVNRLELRSEIAGAIQSPQPADPLVPATAEDIWLRLKKAGDTYSGEYSFDGQTWTAVAGNATNPMASPQFGVFAFGPQATAVGDTVAFDYFLLDGEDQGGEPCSCEDGAGDEFDGTSLNTTKFNSIVRPDPSLMSVSGGKLSLNTTLGDLYGAADSTPIKNILLQSADHAGADWVLETKMDVSQLNGGYAQGGLIAYVDDQNYVKLDPISDQDRTAVNRIELRSEIGGTVQNPQPQVDIPATTKDVWLRLSKAGQTYTGEYSLDGSTWAAMPATVANTMASPKFGIFQTGVQIAGRVLTFDHLKVNGSTGCPPGEEENATPEITAATATPSSGFAPLAVSFAATATDADDDPLTYAWDFDGDGTTDSTQQNPSHTYSAAGDFNAKVTVSDGSDSVSKTVPVAVLAADDPQARFRVLVFSKTTGFRHDSIDEGIAAIKQLGTLHGFQVDASEDATLFRDAVLAKYDTVVFLSTTGDPLDEAQQAAFERYIRGGGGYTGIHAAADTEYDWVWYGNLVGAFFLSHPPGTPSAKVDVEDTHHHSTEGIATPWQRTDEWYNYKSPLFASPEIPDGDFSPRANVHVLATVDESTYDEQDGNTTDDDHPISWCHRYDGGRSWYTGMGHTAASFSEPGFLAHILGGIEVAAGAVVDQACGVSNRAPAVTASRTPTGDITVGDTVQFSATGTDPDGDALTYAWDFADGGTSTQPSPSHQFVTSGTRAVKVTVSDGKGGTASATLEVVVKQPGGGDHVDQPVEVGGNVPGVLSLRIGPAASLGMFVPNVAADYTTALTATVTSTATAATLSVRDPSPTATGRLVNGAAALAQPLQVKAASSAGAGGGAFAPLSTSGSPLALLSYAGAVSGDPVSIELKQSIGANEPLTVGNYSKTVVFTLSTMTP